MADELSASLELDIAAALSAVESLGSTLDTSLATSADTFSAAMADAITAVPPVEIEPDVSAVDPAISDAVAAADTEATVTGDATELTTDVTTAVDAADANVDVTATGADSITGDIDAAVGAADTVVPIEGDPSGALNAIADVASFADAQAPTIEVDADTADAQSAVEDLAASLDSTGASASHAAGGMHEGADAAALLAGSAGLAKGEVGGLNEVAHGVGGAAAAGAVGVGALGAATLEFFHEGVAATGAGQRFNTIVGDMAHQVETVHVGDLTAGIGELGIKFGSTEAEMQNATAAVFQFGINGGKSREESAAFSGQLTALAARAVSLNPNLGNLSDVTENLSARIARGGRFAAAYGLSLSAAEINAKAMGETGKTSAGDLTIQEKAFAAAEIASKRYGDGLDKTVAAGAENALNKQKSLHAQLKEVIETLGKPLVAPIFQIMEDARPLVEDLGRVLADIAVAVMPVLDAALVSIEPPLRLFADIIEALPQPVVALGTALVALRVGFGPVASWAGSGSVMLGKLFTVAETGSGALAKAGAGALIAGAGFQQAGKSGVEGAMGIGEMALGGAMLGAQVGFLAPELAPAAIAIGAVGGAAVGVAKQLFSSGEGVADYRKKFEELSSTLDALAGKAALQKFIDTLGETDRLKLAAGDIKGIKDELVALGTQSPAAAQKVVQAYISMQEAAGHPLGQDQIRELNAAVREGTGAYKEHTTEQQKSAAANAQVTAAASAEAQAETNKTAATKAASDAQSAHNAALAQATTAYQQITVAAQTQAQADANSVAITQQQVLATQGASAGQAAYAQSHLATKVAIDGAAQSTALYAMGQTSAKGATDAQASAVGALRMELALLSGNYYASGSAQLTLEQQSISFNETLDAQGGSLGANRTQVIASEQALYGMGNAANSASTAAAQNGESVQNQIAPLQSYENELETVKQKLISSGDEGGAAFVQSLQDANQRAITNLQNSGGPMQGAAASATGAAVGGVNSQAGAFGAAGSGLGASEAGGLASTGGLLSAIAGGNTASAMNAAGMAGADAHNIGYGIGASFSGGIGDGIYANSNYVAGAARDIVAGAVSAARNAAQIGSPSKLFASEVGLPIAQGVALGINKGASDVERATTGLIGIPAPGAMAAMGRGGAGGGLVLNIAVVVNGVEDPVAAKRAGENAGEGIADALTRRRVVVSARTGG